MRVLGLDIGSRSVDAVWLDGDRVVERAVADSGFDPQAVASFLSEMDGFERVVATGYGRHAAASALGADVVTEIKAYALGVAHLYPDARAVLDIGGQDTKVISLGPRGKVLDFEMNDKCAAGTGKFLEVMARALGFELDELGPAALDVRSGVRISSMCTVFAESEVTGLVHRGEDLRRIALGLHDAIASRTLATLARVCPSGPLVFAGGVARNPAMARLIADGFDGEVLVPEECQTVGALGAALSARADSHAR
ncbi:MAG TPA: acyl-CoA dehydratase activase [Coriobacteriia bacterium]|jgi:predicted CoA-substrate-specific enzyme activase